MRKEKVLKDFPCLYLVALIATLWMSTADATPNKWSLEDVGFSDGTTAGGSFYFDADTNVYSDIGIYSSSGHTYEYEFGGPFPGLWTSESDGDLTDVWLFAMAFTDDLSNVGGVVEIEGGFEGISRFPNAEDGEVFRMMTSGSVTTAPVPEPATITLLGIVLVGFAGAEVRRRRKKAVDNS